MQITVRNALTAYEAASRLAEKPFAPKTSLTIVRMLRELKVIADDHEAVRLKLAEQHCRRDEQGRLIHKDGLHFFIDREAAEAFQAGMKEVEESPVEVKTTLKEDALGNVQVEPMVLFGLGVLLVE